MEWYNNPVPDGKVDVVLDTDAYNEIDDQYAIAFLLANEDRACVKAFYAAPFFNAKSSGPSDGMEKSYEEILHLLHLAKREEMKVVTYRGSLEYLPDENTPVSSEAAKDLCERAMQYSPEHPLYVLAIGAITNIASALLMKPKIRERIVLVWLGGHALHCSHTREFNMRQDFAAARIVFSSGVRMVQLPCLGVVEMLRTTRPELEYWLKGKSPLCDYLVQHTVEEAESYAAGKPWSRVIWDISAVAWLLNEGGRLMQWEVIPAPIPEYDGRYAEKRGDHSIVYVKHIDRDAIFERLFADLTGRREG